MNSLFHGCSSSVAALKPYFPPKPSFFKNPSFFFQRFSQKPPHLSFPLTTSNRPKPIGKTTTWCCNGGEGECIEEKDYHYGGDDTHIYGQTGDNYKIVSEDGGQEVDVCDAYCDKNYSIEGYASGRVRVDSSIQGENIVAGDVLIGLPSSRVHCSGFSLVTRSTYCELPLEFFKKLYGHAMQMVGSFSHENYILHGQRSDSCVIELVCVQ